MFWKGAGIQMTAIFRFTLMETVRFELYEGWIESKAVLSM